MKIRVGNKFIHVAAAVFGALVAGQALAAESWEAYLDQVRIKQAIADSLTPAQLQERRERLARWLEQQAAWRRAWRAAVPPRVRRHILRPPQAQAARDDAAQDLALPEALDHALHLDSEAAAALGGHEGSGLGTGPLDQGQGCAHGDSIAGWCAGCQARQRRSS